MTAQHVIRTVSKSSVNGTFVWEMMEGIDIAEDDPNIHMFIKDKLGTYWLIQCWHFWTKDEADEFANAEPWRGLNQILVIV